MSIFMTRGASLTISGISINLETEEISPPTIHIGYDVYPHWLSIALRAATEAVEIARQLDTEFDGTGKPRAVELLEAEVASSMTAIVAAAAAIDGFYGSAIGRIDRTSSGVGERKRSRDKRILSFFEQKFALKKDTVASLAKPLNDIFSFRHWALHSHGKPEEPAFHPRLELGMANSMVKFRSENALASTEIALKLISYLICLPKPKYTSLVEHCNIARRWVHPILIQWIRERGPLDFPMEMLTFGPTNLTFTRRAVPKYCRA